MDVSARAHATIAASREAVFDAATNPERFHEYFTGYGPIPAIEAVENVGGGPTVEGTVRKVHNSDGSIIEEHMVEFVRPERQRYQLVSGFAPPFSVMIASGEGSWAFDESDGGTRVSWQITFALRSPLYWPVAAPIVGIFMTRAMGRCLDNIRSAVAAQRDAA